MSSSRFGRTLRDESVVEEALLPQPDLADGASAWSTIMTDWWWGQVPPQAIQIPYTWLSRPTPVRHEQPITSYTISVNGGATFSNVDTGSRPEYNDNTLSGTLVTATPATAANFGHWTLAYYATQAGAVPRVRFVTLRINFFGRTAVEQWRILSLTIGRRFQITGAPAAWPASALTQVVEGVHHVIDRTGDPTVRAVELNTVSVPGAVDGTPGPWFRLNDSVLGGTDAVPF